MMRGRPTAIIPILVAIGAASWPGAVSAHAFPTAEYPPAGAVLNAPPPQVRIHFDSPIEPDFSKLRVLNSTSASEAAGPPTVDQSHRDLSVKLKALPPGDYSVRWSVVAEDGHRTEGTYSFRVINPASEGM
jgi:methionine-rich copper-binding protein CopC